MGRLSEDWDSYAAFGKHSGSVTDVDTLDEVFMYSRELSPFEIKTLYDNCNFGSAKTRKSYLGKKGEQLELSSFLGLTWKIIVLCAAHTANTL